MGEQPLCCASTTDLRRTNETNCRHVGEDAWTSVGIDPLHFVALVARLSARNRFSDISSGMSD